MTWRRVIPVLVLMAGSAGLGYLVALLDGLITKEHRL